MSTAAMLAATSSARPPVKPRAPLPPFPPGSYDRTLPWTLPRKARDVLRANAWGVTIPGLPFVPGGSSRHPERCLTWFLDRWTPEWRERILTQHAQRGYTHFVLSWPDARAYGTSLSVFLALVRRVREWFYPIVFLGSKDFDAHDRPAADANLVVSPVMDALFGYVSEYVPCWEMDLWNIPGSPTIDHCKYVGHRAHDQGASCWLHFSSEKTSWFADGDPRGRFGFWDDLGPDVDGLMYQTVPTWDIGETQARCVDTLKQFAMQGDVHRFRFFEDQAALLFDGDRPNEDDADLRGYLACCTNGPTQVYGYGNGGRMPDGSPL